MSTFITRLPPPPGASGILLAVKDLIDVEGVPTTAGSRAVAEAARPADRDAACLAGARAAGAVIVGKANLHELAYGGAGLNEWFGTPVNPLDPSLLPGGSSSGSAVAVADGDADVAYGSDTGGSVRIPAAFCGVTGLKTTYGRVSLDRVWPLAPSLDTVGPMARDVAGVTAGMALLEPGFRVAASVADGVGRIRPAGFDVDPRIDAAVDAALAASGLTVTEVDLPGWLAAREACGVLLDFEAARSNRVLLADPARRALIGRNVLARLTDAERVTVEDAAAARARQPGWREAVHAALARGGGLLALPTVPFFPPRLDAAPGLHFTAFTNAVNLAGLPALALPVPSEHSLPASLQLIGPPGAEGLLLATGAVIEAAVARSRGTASGPRRR
ncbi:MAG TPA: amidase [Streptosporangiaceae bacterium]|nr:amidase [Streptosporangiaceae bacterium]